MIDKHKIFTLLKPTNYFRALKILKRYGVKSGFDKLRCIIYNPNKLYEIYRKRHALTNEEIFNQKSSKFNYSPLISIVVPLYNTKRIYFEQLINSVINQTYDNWELCLADASDNENDIKEILSIYKDFIDKIKYKKINNRGIAINTNEAISISHGDYVAFLDHDDVIEQNALFEVASCLQYKRYDLIYTDEDFTNESLSKFSDPYFKPDFSPDLLCVHNYITHFLFVKKTVLDKVGNLNSTYDGAQDYDLVLRCFKETNNILHIPKVLYHWRMCETSVAGDKNNKIYAYEAGRNALSNFFQSRNIDASVSISQNLGYYDVTYNLVDRPLISIIIPNKDHVEDLKVCLDSIYEKNTYENFEVIICENNSSNATTFNYYKNLKENYKNIKIVTYKGSFNYAAINNLAVKHAMGKYYLFLNNDTKIVEPNFISKMLGHFNKPWVGAVGARLLYEDNTIQHAGVVVGLSDAAGHVFGDLYKNDRKYKMHPQIICNYSAVTAACMMVSKKIFNSVKGFDEDFKVAFNDVDFCLKVRKLNKFIVYDPSVVLYHYESKSRGYENTPSKIKRFEKERLLLLEKWPEYFNNGDPFYNPNFNYYDEPFIININ